METKIGKIKIFTAPSVHDGVFMTSPCNVLSGTKMNLNTGIVTAEARFKIPLETLDKVIEELQDARIKLLVRKIRKQNARGAGA